MSNEEYREAYDTVMTVLQLLDVNHPARLGFGGICEAYDRLYNEQHGSTL